VARRTPRAGRSVSTRAGSTALQQLLRSTDWYSAFSLVDDECCFDPSERDGGPPGFYGPCRPVVYTTTVTLPLRVFDVCLVRDADLRPAPYDNRAGRSVRSRVVFLGRMPDCDVTSVRRLTSPPLTESVPSGELTASGPRLRPKQVEMPRKRATKAFSMPARRAPSRCVAAALDAPHRSSTSVGHGHPPLFLGGDLMK